LNNYRFLWFLALMFSLCFTADGEPKTAPHSLTEQSASHSLDLTEDERTWLQQHRKISVAVKHGYSPIEFLFELQAFRGISVDYLKKLESILDVEFIKSMSHQSLADNDTDMVSAISSTSLLEGTRYQALNKPFLTTPVAIFTKKGAPRLDGLKDLYGKKVAVFKSGIIAKLLAKEHPQIKLYLVDIAEEALEALETKKVDAYIGNSVIIKYVLKSAENEQIEFNINTPYKSEIYMAVRADWPELKSILEKALMAMPEDEKTEILNKWTYISYSKKLNYQLIGSILAVSMIILTVFYVSNRRLKHEVKQRMLLETSLIKAKVEAEQAERTIRQYSKDLERLAMVARHTTDAVVITDAEGYTLWVNQAFTHSTGYTLQEIIGKKPGILLQGKETSPEAKHKLQQAVRNFTDLEVELINYRKNGEPYWVKIKIVAIVNSLGERRFIAVQTDVTRQVNYICTIKANQEDMDALFSLSPDGIVVIGSEGTISYVNDAFIKLTGIPRETLQGTTEQMLDKLLRAQCSKPEEYQSQDEYAAQLNSTLHAHIEDGGIPKPDFKFQIDTPKQLIFERSCIESNQKRISRVLYFKDVTQKVMLEDMKSEFITTAAHELRTPMSVILGYSELLKMRAFQPEMHNEMVDAIHNKSVMVASLLDDLLDVAIIEYRAEKTLKIEKHAFNPFIKSIVNNFIYPHNPNRIILETLPEVPDFYFDAQRVERAITNCITNAYKFSDHASEIKMSVNVTRSSAPEIAISVIDKGIGMTPEQLSRIFEKFYRADKSGHIPGTGLGMVLVKDIMEAHGGRVEVDSKFGKGTTVTLYLPIREDSTQ